MIDIHCHILPGVDDGSRSLDESIQMARRAVDDGIREIVATPHSMDGVYLNPVEEILSAVVSLQKTLSRHQIDLILHPGSDLHLCTRMAERVVGREILTVNDGGKYILLELPSQMIPTGVKNEIFSLKVSGITPIITHPERNAVVQRDPGILYELVEMGALTQVTAMSVTGDFGGFIAELSEDLLRRRLIHIIATDAHSPNDRPPVLSKAVEKAADILKNWEEALRMVTTLPAAILSGTPLEVPEPLRSRRRGRL